MSALPYAHGGPPLRGTLRATPEDFEVDEDLGFELSGSGEHAFVRIEKREANTEWVADRFAALLGLDPTAVGFSGLKDRHAVTRQTFSIHLPGRVDPDWSSLDIEGVRVLEATRHTRKLKRGAHRGNRFVIRLRDVEGDADDARRVIDAIVSQGVPNYFGEQRFGRDGDNLERARALFAGRRMGRSQRGFALSAARSWLFNAVLARRVADGTWNAALEGEVWMLAGTHSIFGPQPLDDTLLARLADHDIDPTGPMWGRGELRTAAVVRELETAAASLEPSFAEGLAGADLRQERRSLRLIPLGLDVRREGPSTWQLAFWLPSGAFATTVVRELCATDGQALA